MVKNLAKLLLPAVFSLVLACAFTHPLFAERLQGVLERCSDGDTIVLKSKGGTSKVRLIGIDSPEREDNEKAHRDSLRQGIRLSTILEMGERASDHLKSFLKQGQVVTLETDVASHDRYGRLLAYAYLEDGTFINKKMVEDGYASAYTIPPNVRYADVFKAAMRKAREEKRGLWK